MATRISQVAVETFVTGQTTKARLSQLAVETFVTGQTTKVRLSQLAVEVFVLTGPQNYTASFTLNPSLAYANAPSVGAPRSLSFAVETTASTLIKNGIDAAFALGVVSDYSLDRLIGHNASLSLDTTHDLTYATRLASFPSLGLAFELESDIHAAGPQSASLGFGIVAAATTAAARDARPTLTFAAVAGIVLRPINQYTAEITAGVQAGITSTTGLVYLDDFTLATELAVADAFGWHAAMSVGSEHDVAYGTRLNAAGLIGLTTPITYTPTSTKQTSPSLALAALLDHSQVGNVHALDELAFAVESTLEDSVAFLYKESLDFDVDVDEAFAGGIRVATAFGLGAQVAYTHVGSRGISRSMTLRARARVANTNTLQAQTTLDAALGIHAGIIGGRLYNQTMSVDAGLAVVTGIVVGIGGPSVLFPDEDGLPDVFQDPGATDTPSVFGDGDDDSTPEVFRLDP